MRDEITRQSGGPVVVEDDATESLYVLLPMDQYRSLFDDSDFDLAETYAAQSAVAGASGWDDPEMDRYDNYDANRPQP